MIVYHYTISSYLDDILKDGVIKCTDAYIPAGELPVCWFSSNPIWEPTSNKSRPGDVDWISFYSSTTVAQRMSFTRQMGDGLFRFAIPEGRVLPWHKLCSVAKISYMQKKKMEKRGRMMGGIPTQWYGSIAPIATSECLLEIYGADGRWYSTQKEVA